MNLIICFKYILLLIFMINKTTFCYPKSFGSNSKSETENSSIQKKFSKNLEKRNTPANGHGKFVFQFEIK
jgi:hypothetical protein